MSTKVRYINQDHIIDRQHQSEQEFLTRLADAKPTFEQPQVEVNPYLINPLCALVLFRTETEVAPTVTVCGKRNEREDISHSFPAATKHLLPVLGLYENFTNKVVISLPDGRSTTIDITTGPLPEEVCRCLNIHTSADYLGTNIMFLTPAGKNLPTGYDYRGDIRWLLTENTMFDIKRVANGNIITGSSRFCHMPYNATGLIELNLLGKIYKEYRLPGNYHHDHFEMEDGNLLALTQDFSRDTVEDMCVLLDRNTGEILKSWDYRDVLPMDVGGSGSQDAHDWFHNNAVWYDKKTNSIVLSGRHQDGVISIDYDSGALNWILGDPEGWPQEMVDKYFFTPVGDLANFDWQYEQHACVVCPDGDIMMFDNGQYRAKNKENYIKNRENFSRGVRYRIDTEKMEIEQIWQYGKERGQDFFSPYICNVEYYDEGHYMIHSGGIGFENGYASDSLGAFLDMKTPGVELRSVTVEEKDGVVLYELETEGNFYRAEKLPLYHDGANLELGAGKLLGSLEVTEEFDTEPEAEEVMELPESWHNVFIEEDVDRFVFHGRFERGSLVMLCLENKGESHRYFINTAAVWSLAMCSGAFLEKDDRDIKIHVSKRGLSGVFQAKLIINDKKFQTGVSIICQ
ncbi:aryl-sulfate sulfotransferase [Desulfofustis glycolicus]|uniref:Arylsulfate sulfotransferase n=1 Tax=Desulfofustis glycolicus DSM 9705 TaxID=1121409 RepID=A0A1M5YKI8_9BACT|nr:aryl-sulfate sulfotransferase [Desulfofustis glycolicus]MCB2214774.1 aryl-sulfate sulfotransferase [Desulfobulbaceae bacterium]SHI12520.1 arylsulfate sulfotransferase [Desulfofustis glycolicus DSM 9705]